MNGWPFDDDHPYRYYHPAPRSRNTASSLLLLVSVLYLIRQLLRLAGSLLWGIAYLLLLLLRFTSKLIRRKKA